MDGLKSECLDGFRLDQVDGFVGILIRSAYFAAGRYEDALRMVERQPADSRTMGGWMQRAASYAALGRLAEAHAAVADALARHPNLTIQGLLSRPDFSDSERQQFEELMRKAGFPVCAKPEELAKYTKPYRLLECAH
jgi:tetratricopeptide (TPR) repeat protein